MTVRAPSGKLVSGYGLADVGAGGRWQAVTQGPPPKPALRVEGGYVGTGLIAPPIPKAGHYLTAKREAADPRTCAVLRRLREIKRGAKPLPPLLPTQEAARIGWLPEDGPRD